MANGPDAAPPTLTREVEPPQNHHGGLGIMLVASAAMFFAVAGSALILRARMAQCHSVRASGLGPAPMVAPRAAAAPETCGGLSYIIEVDGTTTAHYTVCPGVDVVHAADTVFVTELPADVALRIPESTKLD